MNIGGEPRYEIHFGKSLENLRRTTSKMAENDAKRITEKLKTILQ
jgi:hypothetical protein